MDRFEERSAWMVYLNMDPRLDELRSDARFIQLVHRVDPPQPKMESAFPSRPGNVIAYRLSSRINQVMANSQSRRIVRGEMLRISLISSSLMPPK